MLNLISGSGSDRPRPRENFRRTRPRPFLPFWTDKTESVFAARGNGWRGRTDCPSRWTSGSRAAAGWKWWPVSFRRFRRSCCSVRPRGPRPRPVHLSAPIYQQIVASLVKEAAFCAPPPPPLPPPAARLSAYPPASHFLLPFAVACNRFLVYRGSAFYCSRRRSGRRPAADARPRLWAAQNHSTGRRSPQYTAKK